MTNKDRLISLINFVYLNGTPGDILNAEALKYALDEDEILFVSSDSNDKTDCFTKDGILDSLRKQIHIVSTEESEALG